jgi:hypothetical protein
LALAQFGQRATRNQSAPARLSHQKPDCRKQFALCLRAERGQHLLIRPAQRSDHPVQPIAPFGRQCQGMGTRIVRLLARDQSKGFERIDHLHRTGPIDGKRVGQRRLRTARLRGNDQQCGNPRRRHAKGVQRLPGTAVRLQMQQAKLIAE